MKKLIILLLNFLFAAAILAQGQNSNNIVNQESNFNLDFLDFASEESNKTRLDVFVQVPFNELQFVKSNNGFTAQYTVTISVFDKEKEKLIVEKIWNEKLEEKEFQNTSSKGNFNLSLRSFNLDPGTYTIRTAVEDKDSRNAYVKEEQVEVKNLNESFSASDIMLIARQTSVNGNNKIIPNVSKNVYSQKDGLPVFFELYSDIPRSIELHYSIREKENIIYQDTVSRAVDSGRTQIFYTVKNIELSLGEYTFAALIKDENGKSVSTVKNFTSRWVGLPSSIKDLDKAIEQMVYIASGTELDEIEEAKTKEEKLKKYQEFWKKKDPNPANEENQVFDEYYSRVNYANQNFSHYIEGWRTDRGMVFIILGAPNNIERHPFEYDSKPYEVWEYFELNKQFVFLDETGFGDYRLITPLYGDFYRYR